MRTDDLIANLSEQPSRVRFFNPSATLFGSALFACGVVALLSLGWLGPHANLGHAVAQNHLLMLNLVFTISVGSIALAIARDLSVPGRRRRLPSSIIVLPFLLMAMLALLELGTSSLHGWSSHATHDSWLTCLWQIAALATPAFAILAIGMRSLAPTDLRRAGIHLGLLAGAIGAMGYCLHAPNQPLSVGLILSTAGIVTMAAVGGLVGPKLLRWR